MRWYSNSRSQHLMFAGDVSRLLGVLPSRGAPAWPAGVDFRTQFHCDKQPFSQWQHEGSLRGECLSDTVAGRQRECSAESVSSNREEYPGSPDTR